MSSTLGAVRVRVEKDETGRLTVTITTKPSQAALDITVDLRADEAELRADVFADEPVADVADSDVD